jgi:hypothetical protein
MSYCGVVGIDEELHVFGGYDEQFTRENSNEEFMSHEEKIKLADIMIKRWTDFKSLKYE